MFFICFIYVLYMFYICLYICFIYVLYMLICFIYAYMFYICLYTRVYVLYVRCNDCSPGRFTASLGTSICSECPMGQFQNVSHATSCMLCPKVIYIFMLYICLYVFFICTIYIFVYVFICCYMFLYICFIYNIYVTYNRFCRVNTKIKSVKLSVFNALRGDFKTLWARTFAQSVQVSHLLHASSACTLLFFFVFIFKTYITIFKTYIYKKHI